MLRIVAAGVFGFALVSAPAWAQQGAPSAPRPAAAGPSKDATAAAAGTYKLDPMHTSVVARVPHGGGMSFSTFRFGTTSGTLQWDPANIENSKVEITVEPKSIMTPVTGFADELGGDRFLNAGKFPDAKFVSTSIRRTGPTKGQITGNLTFMGQTRPITVEAELVGAGSNMRGVPTVGFTGTTRFKRSDFGFSAMAPVIGDEITLVIDTEFNKS
jgi:polyisoprenoid-binding protein YceI